MNSTKKQRGKIDLKTILFKEEHYKWTHLTGEASASLRPYLKDQGYCANFTIQPLQSPHYLMTGTFETHSLEDCSRCGLEFKHNINEQFCEILIPKETEALPTLGGGGDTSSFEYQPDGYLDMGEYLRELFLLSRPYIPVPPEDAKGSCSICQKNVSEHNFNYDDVMEETEEKQSPFSVLKNIKF